MPGRKDRNLRCGDIHESLGLLLLQGIALVAPVPRPEDVGADAYCVLLRPTSPRDFTPADSFLVQLKASSVRVLEYNTAADVSWLDRLELPLLIGSVDISDGSISLYPTHNLSRILLEVPHREIHLFLDAVDESASPPGVRYVNVDCPALKWSTKDLAQREFPEHAYRILKPHIARQRENIQLRNIGRYDVIKWETNVPPLCEQGSMIMSCGPQDYRRILESIVPAIGPLVSEMAVHKRYADFPALALFIEMMRRHGVDPDPGGTLMQVALLLADGDEISEEDIVRLRSFGFPGRLDLTRTHVTDSALGYIPETTELLSLSETMVTDHGIQHLRRLRNLRRLNLTGTQVTDVAIQTLKNLPRLEWLNVAKTCITDTGLAGLRKVLPRTTIITEGI